MSNNTKPGTPSQEHEINRSQKVMKYLQMHQASVDTFLPLKQRQTFHAQHFSALGISISKKLPPSKEITAEKKKYKTDVGIFYDSVCSICRAYLIEKNNPELAANFKITARAIKGLADGEVKGVVIQINKLITDHLIPQPDFAPYNITAATLLQGLALATTFDQSIGAKANQIAKRYSVSLDIAAHIKLLKQDIKLIALLMQHFQTSHEDFYNGFLAVKNIDNIGIRHNIIKGKVTLNGKPIHKALITCSKITKKAETDLLGSYTFPRLRAGRCFFTCTPPGHSPQTKEFTVVRGKTLELNWEF